MKSRLNNLAVRLVAVGLVVLAYFVVFPEDATTLLAPAASVSEGIAVPLSSILDVTNHLSPWFYGLAAVGIIAWSAVRIWGRPSGRRPDHA